MPGQISQIIKDIIRKRSKGDEIIAFTTKTKLILKGINPDRYTATSADDAVIIAKLRTIAAELGIQL